MGLAVSFLSQVLQLQSNTSARADVVGMELRRGQDPRIIRLLARVPVLIFRTAKVVTRKMVLINRNKRVGQIKKDIQLQYEYLWRSEIRWT